MPITSAMRQEVAAIRESMHKALGEAHQRSLRSGKPLLILVGEDHLSPSSMLLELIVYQEARKLGVSDIALELSSRNHDRAREAIQTFPITRISTDNHICSYAQALYHGHRIHYVDGRHDAAIPGNTRVDYRNETIAANLHAIHAPTIAFGGFNHLPGLQKTMAAYRSHEVLSIDNSLKKRGQFNLSLGFKAQDLLLDELIVLGLGEKEGAAFIGWADQTHHKVSYKLKKTQVSHIQNQPFLLLPSVENCYAHAASLYEVGRDAEAGKFFAHAFHMAKRHPEKYQNYFNFAHGGTLEDSGGMNDKCWKSYQENRKRLESFSNKFCEQLGNLPSPFIGNPIMNKAASNHHAR